MKTLLWFDESNNPYRGSGLYKFAPEYEIENRVVWVKNFKEFVVWISINGLPTEIAINKQFVDNMPWLVDFCLIRELDMPNLIEIKSK